MNIMIYTKNIAILFTCLLISLNVHAQNHYEFTKLTASDGGNSEFFGKSVAISGNYAIVGAPLDNKDANGENLLTEAGSAYILEKQGECWVQIQKLLPSERVAEDQFGHSVSISGNYAVVGAYLEDEDENDLNNIPSSGSVYVFEKQGENWTQVQKVVASDRKLIGLFGWSVDLAGDYLIVGAIGEPTVTAEQAAGAAYIFEKQNGIWTEVAKVMAADAAKDDYFGVSVGISNEIAIIGAYWEDQNASGGQTFTKAGSAYIFEKQNGSWTQAQKIVPQDRTSFDYFGFSVSISGTTALVGAYQEDENEMGNSTLDKAGSAYFFEKQDNTWIQTQKVVAGDRGAIDYFGYAVDIDQNYAVIGAYSEDEDALGEDPIENAGSVYLLKKEEGTWAEVQKIVTNDRGINDEFGYAVGISGTDFIVGANAPLENPNAQRFLFEAGSAYVFGDLMLAISFPTDMEENVAAGLCSQTISWTHPNVSGLCGSPELSITYSAGEVEPANLPESGVVNTAMAEVIFDVGETLVTYTISESSRNFTATHSFTVTIQDNINPEAICPSVAPVVSLNAMGQGTLATNALAGTNSTDNCTLTETSVATDFDCDDVGTQMVMLTATDASDNTNSVMCSVTVQDVITPTLTCPETQYLDLDLSCQFVMPNYMSVASMSDNCSVLADMTVSQSPMPGSMMGGPIVFRSSITVVDESNNASTCIFDIEVCLPSEIYTMDQNEIDILNNDDIAQFFDSHFDCTQAELVDFMINPTGIPQNPNAIIDLLLTFGDINGGDDITCLTSVILGEAPLSVNWLDFNVQLNEDKEGVLNWKTDREMDNDYFVIERSINGLDFIAIGEVETKGTSNATQSYRFIDTKIVMGLNYYRIKQVDWTGKSSYSEIQYLYMGESTFGIYPNPTKDEVNLLFDLDVDDVIEIEVFNTAGQLIYTSPLVLSPSGIGLSFSAMNIRQSGIYWIRAKTSTTVFSPVSIVKID